MGIDIWKFIIQNFHAAIPKIFPCYNVMFVVDGKPKAFKRSAVSRGVIGQPPCVLFSSPSIYFSFQWLNSYLICWSYYASYDVKLCVQPVNDNMPFSYLHHCQNKGIKTTNKYMEYDVHTYSYLHPLHDKRLKTCATDSISISLIHFSLCTLHHEVIYPTLNEVQCNNFHPSASWTPNYFQVLQWMLYTSRLDNLHYTSAFNWD